ncbi:hypothetical protein Glove_421g102 [Diversispora epigaea]|uniref:Uncharacterized protein n=1 Tax=Diversispora epigaea TaxID=1348612 RepID=A0A397H0S5_9GLOM|nr:hypothetical protein Glove_421g102 [Diversispora epigaea]
MPKHRQVQVRLIEIGSLIEDIHYGPFSRFWWEFPSIPNLQTRFPIRIGQKTHTHLNEHDFYITILNKGQIPEYLCQSDNFSAIETSATKAISKVYQDIFHNRTRYSDPIVIGWNNEKIINILSSNIDFYPFTCKLNEYEIFIYGLGSSTYLDWNKAGNGYKSSLIHTYMKRQAIFVSEIENDKCFIHIYQDFKLHKTFSGNTPNEVWKNSGFIQKYSGKQLFGLEDQIIQQKLNKFRIPRCLPHEWKNFDLMNNLYQYHLRRQSLANINWYNLFIRWNQNENNIIELNSELKLLYPPDYKFSNREIGAWFSMLRATGCFNITPWLQNESEYLFWTKSQNPAQEKLIFKNLFRTGFLISKPVLNYTQTFWKCFKNALNCNKKNRDGKRRILSIIANDFTYEELENNLQVSTHTIQESRKHAILNGFGCPPLEKPIIHRLKFKKEQIDQFENFFTRKDVVNMSSYQNHSKSGLPIMYLQDYKQSLWEKFSEEYPNGIRRTAFMTRLQRSRYVFQDNLGGLCSECNEYGYEIFASINTIINAHIEDENLKKTLIQKSHILRRYIRREYIKKLKIIFTGIPKHESCICHCLKYAFGTCNIQHIIICNTCKNIFDFFDQIKNFVNVEIHETLDDYMKKLISWMGHHARKLYLNTHVQVNLDELDENGAVLIVDYKMRILPQSAREIKSQFFGKRGWTLHSSLVYTKNISNNELDIQVFDHWSDDTGQDAWFTASSLHTVFENIDPKPKWITIISDNGPHYHCTELMLIIGHWNEWYNIVPRKWIFLEAGEAKTLIDSHHAQISHAIKRHVKLGNRIEKGNDIETAINEIAGTKVANIVPNRNQDKEKIGTIPGIKTGEAKTLIDSHHAQISHAIKRHVKLGNRIEKGNDIETAINEIAGTKVANIVPNRNQDKEKIGTIPGIKSYHEWTWPDQGENSGFICARILPGIGEWKKWSPVQIEKIQKERINEKPNPQYSTHSESSKKWILPIANRVDSGISLDDVNCELTELNQNISNLDENITNIERYEVFVLGWALNSNKNSKKEPWKQIKKNVKHILENMFHTGTANPNHKFSAQQMHEELIRLVQFGELEENDIPKISTIQNWITGFSRKWKEVMAIRELEEMENTRNT